MKVSENNTVVAFTRAEHETSENSDSDEDPESPDKSTQKSEEFSSDSNEEVTI